MKIKKVLTNLLICRANARHWRTASKHAKYDIKKFTSDLHSHFWNTVASIDQNSNSVVQGQPAYHFRDLHLRGGGNNKITYATCPAAIL